MLWLASRCCLSVCSQLKPSLFDRCMRKALTLCSRGSTVPLYTMFVRDQTSFRARLAPRICKWWVALTFDCLLSASLNIRGSEFTVILSFTPSVLPGQHWPPCIDTSIAPKATRDLQNTGHRLRRKSSPINHPGTCQPAQDMCVKQHSGHVHS